ncbi:MAG: hypothetical protein H7327_02875 [Herminiimonas sp.]|nr:hypothetical protein [Herminiimonas sp.]
MELNQLQVVYHEPEDRLLLRVAATDEGEAHELQAWLTRRFVGNLWAAMQQALGVQVTLTHPDAAHASAELIDMAHQSALSALSSHGGFGDRFQPDLEPHASLSAPILVSEAKFHIAANMPMRINFLPAEGIGVEIAFTDTELHGFCTLLQAAVETASWEMPLYLESAWAGASDAGELGSGLLAPASRTLN